MYNRLGDWIKLTPYTGECEMSIYYMSINEYIFAVSIVISDVFVMIVHVTARLKTYFFLFLYILKVFHK